jgi:hypothetical protein
VVRALIKEGAIPVSPGRVSQDLKGRVGGFESRTREIVVSEIGNLVCILQTEEAEEDRVVEDSVMIVCR